MLAECRWRRWGYAGGAYTTDYLVVGVHLATDAVRLGVLDLRTDGA